MKPFKVMATRKAAPGLSAFVPAGSYQDNAFDPQNAQCTIAFLNTGLYDVDGAAVGQIASGTWKTGGGANSDYQVRWTPTSGTPGGSATGTWHTLNGNPGWSVTRSSLGTSSVTGTVEIRMTASPNTVLATGSIQLTAVKEI